MRRLRIAQVAPPLERVPPAAYGGTERVVDELTRQLVDRGHDVTTFASGDSDVPGRLVPTVERALRPAGIESDASAWFATTVKMVIEQAADFDVIHSHLEWWSIPLARLSPAPVVSTFHGRLDLPWADRLFSDAPDGMVAISRHQASTHPDVPWTIIHNGLTLDRAPFVEEPGDAFCFVGRVDSEKGIIEAIDIALRAGRHLRIAAKVGNLARQRDYYESVFRPALQRAGRSVEYLGELQPAERDQLFAESYATLMPGAWPEPFGLVSIESLACGTPVLARRVGALPEIIREGVDGFFGDDAVAMAFFADRLGTLDRREIRERVIERFSAARMADRYEELYARMIAVAGRVPGGRERAPDAAEVEEALAVQLPVQVTEPADAELPEKRNGATAPEPEAAAEPVEIIALPGPTDHLEAPVETSEERAAPIEEPAAAIERQTPAIERQTPAIEERAEAYGLEVEALGAPIEEPEPVAAVSGRDDREASSEREAAREELEQAAVVAVEAAVVDVVVANAPEVEAEAEAEPEVSEAVAEPEPLAEAGPEPLAEAEPIAEPEPVAITEPVAEREPEPVAEREPVTEAQPQPVAIPAAADEAPVATETAVTEPQVGQAPEPSPEVVAAASEAPATRMDRTPVAVGPGPAPVEPEPRESAEAKPAEPKAAAPEALEPKPVEGERAEPKGIEPETVKPKAVEPEIVKPKAVEAEPTERNGVEPKPVEAKPVEPKAVEAKPEPQAVEPKPAVPAGEPARPAPKPAAKRPIRSISIFKRSWSSGSGKKAASARRRDHS